MSTSRYPRGHVQLSRAPRTWARTWWCAMLCSVCGGGGALAGGSWARLVKWGGVVPMFQCFRHVIRHRQTHFHKAQHTRRCIWSSYPICGERALVYQLAIIWRSGRGGVLAIGIGNGQIIYHHDSATVLLLTVIRGIAHCSLLRFQIHNFGSHEITVTAREHPLIQPWKRFQL